MFGSRQSGFVGLFQKMFPSMLDEPDLYKRFEDALLSRIVEGVDVTKAVETPGLMDVPDGQRIVLPNFEAESSLLKSMWISLEQSSDNPFVETSDKASRLTRFITDDLSQIQSVQAQGGIAIPLTSGRTLLVLPQWDISFALASNFINLSQQIRASELAIPEAQELATSFDSLADLAASLMVPLDPAADSVEAETVANEELSSTDEDVVSEDNETIVDGEVTEGVEAVESTENTQVSFDAEVDQYLNFARFMMTVPAQVDDFQFTLFRALYIDELMLYLFQLSDIDQRIINVQNQNLVPHPDDLEARDRILNTWKENGIKQTALDLEGQLNQLREQIISSSPAGPTPEAEQFVFQQVQTVLGASAPAQWINAVSGLFLQANAAIGVVIPTAESILAKKEQALEVSGLIVTQAQEQKNQLAQLFEVHGDEIFAQRDLIRSILTYDFTEVDEDFTLGLVELLGDTLEFPNHPSYNYLKAELSDAKVMQTQFKLPVKFN